jgi:GNAT superfamily N-acetyltransferase
MPDKINLVIRDARPEELEAVSDLLREAYREYEQYFPGDAWEEYLANVRDVRSRLAEAQLIVAELDGRLAGTVTLYLDQKYSDVWPAGWAGIRLLGVYPAFRGKGIGRALMDECLRRCRSAGFKVVGLHTGDMMKTAQRMYEAMGFERAPEFDFHPGPDHVVMAYKLRL